MPELEDSFFYKAVVYICEHRQGGAVGIIVNRPTDYPLSFVFEQLNIQVSMPCLKDKPVLFGGPVQQDRGFVIHRPCKNFNAGIVVSDDVCVSTSKESLEQLALGKGPKEVLVALGYTGWGANQLDEEIKQNVWLNCPATDSLLFNTSYESRWEKALESLGIDIDNLSNECGHA